MTTTKETIRAMRTLGDVIKYFSLVQASDLIEHRNALTFMLENYGLTLMQEQMLLVITAELKNRGVSQ